mmetsp:Transcript_11705/g.21193  ORF Transcript_11705/g.21193 Transcript_11705/m.21193 type:complete len:212 (+) Transcript_11705:990-1625(+)
MDVVYMGIIRHRGQKDGTRCAWCVCLHACTHSSLLGTLDSLLLLLLLLFTPFLLNVLTLKAVKRCFASLLQHANLGLCPLLRGNGVGCRCRLQDCCQGLQTFGRDLVWHINFKFDQELPMPSFLWHPHSGDRHDLSRLDHNSFLSFDADDFRIQMLYLHVHTAQRLPQAYLWDQDKIVVVPQEQRVLLLSNGNDEIPGLSVWNLGTFSPHD